MVNRSDLKLSTGDRDSQDLVKAETDKAYRITIDGYSWNEIHEYHNPSGFRNYFWYRVPTCCVPPTIVIGTEFVDSNTLQRHELSAIFGDMPDTDFQSLLESVQTDGFIDPIVRIHEGHILDGWHRYRAAQELNLIRKLRFQEWNEDERKDGDPKVFVLARNIERRHLTPGQRAQIVVEVNGWLAHGDVNSQRDDVSNDTSQSKSTADLARDANVGTATINRAKEVSRAGKAEEVISGEKTAGDVLKEKALEHLYQNRQDFQTAVSDFAQSGAYLDFTYCRRRIKALVGLEDSTDEGSTDSTQWDLQKIRTQSQIAEESVLVIKGYLDEDPKIEGYSIATLLSEMQRISEIHQSAKLDTYTRPFLHQPLSDAVEKIEKLWSVSDWEAKSAEERLDDLNELETCLPGLIEAEDTARETESSEETVKDLWAEVTEELPKWKQRYGESGKKENELIQGVRQENLIETLRDWDDSDATGPATVDELKELLDLMKRDSFPFIFAVRKLLSDALTEETVASDSVDITAVQRDIEKAREKVDANGGMVSFRPIANKHGIEEAEVGRIASSIAGSSEAIEVRLASLTTDIEAELKVWQNLNPIKYMPVKMSDLVCAYRYVYGDTDKEGDPSADELSGILEAMREGYRPFEMNVGQQKDIRLRAEDPAQQRYQDAEEVDVSEGSHDAEKAEALDKFGNQKAELYARIEETSLISVKDEFGFENSDKARHRVMVAAHKAYDLPEDLLWSDQAIEELSAEELRKMTGQYFLMVQDFAAPRADWVAALYQQAEGSVDEKLPLQDALDEMKVSAEINTITKIMVFYDDPNSKERLSERSIEFSDGSTAQKRLKDLPLMVRTLLAEEIKDL
ncbi:hypothetical protein C6503_19415 [Candidatus Poribacteria bacterium]|nr:MAG: hypothetical protein C6503_19415 [Candidatus Poribacteria bacterium]